MIVATNYRTKWVKMKVLQDNLAKSIAKFLYENIITQFNCPTHLVSDQGNLFMNCSIKLVQ